MSTAILGSRHPVPVNDVTSCVLQRQPGYITADTLSSASLVWGIGRRGSSVAPMGLPAFQKRRACSRERLQTNAGNNGVSRISCRRR